MNAVIERIERRSLGGWDIYADDRRIGWAVKHGKTWRAYVAKRDGDGQLVGTFAKRRDAVSEVVIERDYWGAP
jgi:hypothetical protein